MNSNFLGDEFLSFYTNQILGMPLTLIEKYYLNYAICILFVGD